VSGFSLWSEPWIPVQRLDGKADRVSLLEVLTQAHDLRDVLDPSPLVTVALHRLMLALIYRTHRLDGMSDWQRLWKAGRFDEAALTAYGRQHADRFDLIHPTRPFYQVPYMRDEKVHPVAALLLEASSGNNPALFDHGRVEGSTVLPFDRAACYLVAHQAFAIGGGVSKPFNRMDAPLTKGIVVEPVGESLFETLMLNAIPMERWRGLIPSTEADRPFWEEDAPPEPVREGTVPLGPLDYLTWQSRRIHLVVDQERQVVTGVQIAQRYCLPKEGTRFDPGKAYVKDDKKQSGWQPLRLQKDRAAWRLTHVLLQPTEDRQAQPEVVAWLAALRYRERIGGVRLPKTVSLTVSGLTTDPKLAAKIDLWRREEIGLPLAVVEDPSLVAAVNRLMTVASRVEKHLRRTSEALIWALTERGHQAEAIRYVWTGSTGSVRMPPTVAPVARGLGLTLRYWAAMEGPFREALWRLPEDGPEAVERAWLEALRRNVRAAMDAVLESLRAGGAPWEPLVLVEDAFARRLAVVLQPDGKEEDDDDSDDD